jgi:hypothetical protein
MGHAQKALTDLEQANAFGRITEAIQWLDDPDTLDADAAYAYNRLTASTRKPRFPTNTSAATHRQCRAFAHALKKDCKKRCHHYNDRGHIRRNCTNRA